MREDPPTTRRKRRGPADRARASPGLHRPGLSFYALRHVFGYAAANDVTARDQQRSDGQFTRVLEPGRHSYRKARTTLQTVDVRPRNIVVSGQELLTSDGITLKVSVLAVWHIADPLAYVTASAGADQMLYAGLQLAIDFYELVGARELLARAAAIGTE